jgi:metacaspase-1
MSTKTALCIGINNYPGTQNDLYGCVNDANDWAAELQRKGYTIKMLLDAKATNKNILGETQAILTKTRPGDSVVIQYSGHGSYVPDEDGDEPDGMDECICPYDIVSADGSNNFITDDQLFEVYSKRDRDSKLVIIYDSCHSGTVSRMAPALSTNGFSRKAKFLPPSVFLPKQELEKIGRAMAKSFRSASAPGRYAGLLMAGCQDKQVSYDAELNGKANGAFSYVALNALKKLKATATYADWFKAIREKLPSEDYSQTPNLFGSSGMKAWKVFS